MKLHKERVRPRRVEHCLYKALKRGLVSNVRVAPARMLLAFPDSLDHEGSQAFAEVLHARDIVGSESRRPGAEQALIEEVLDIAVGDDFVIDLGAPGAVEPEPLGHPPAPFSRDLGDEREAHATVLTALGVVRRGRNHRTRPGAQTLLREMMKGGDRDAETARIAPDFVQR